MKSFEEGLVSHPIVFQFENNTFNTVVMFKDEKFCMFPDHRPASSHHYLIIPKVLLRIKGIFHHIYRKLEGVCVYRTLLYLLHAQGSSKHLSNKIIIIIKGFPN